MQSCHFWPGRQYCFLLGDPTTLFHSFKRWYYRYSIYTCPLPVCSQRKRVVSHPFSHPGDLAKYWAGSSVLISFPEWMATGKRNPLCQFQGHIVCIHCLKELSDRVIPWIFPDWMCDHFWHIPHSICRKSSWCSECSYKKQIPVYKQITSSAQNLCPWFLTAPPWLAVGSELSVRRHWQPLFFLLLLSSGFEEVQRCCSGDCSSVMQRCFRTMLWCLVAPTTTETSPEVKLWSKRKLWRNFYLICIPLIHLHIHPAQYASLLATSTC